MQATYSACKNCRSKSRMIPNYHHDTIHKIRKSAAMRAGKCNWWSFRTIWRKALRLARVLRWITLYWAFYRRPHVFCSNLKGLQSQESRFYWKNLKYANWVWKITEERRERTTPWALLAHWIPPRAGLCFLTWLFRSFLNCNEQTSWRPLSVLPTTDSFCFSFRVSQFAEKLLGMTTVSHKEAASPTLLQVGIFMKAP